MGLNGLAYKPAPSPTRGGNDRLGRTWSPDGGLRRRRSRSSRRAPRPASRAPRSASRCSSTATWTGPSPSWKRQRRICRTIRRSTATCRRPISRAPAGGITPKTGRRRSPPPIARSTLDANAPEPYFNRALALEGLEQQRSPRRRPGATTPRATATPRGRARPKSAARRCHRASAPCVRFNRARVAAGRISRSQSSVNHARSAGSPASASRSAARDRCGGGVDHRGERVVQQRARSRCRRRRRAARGRWRRRPRRWRRADRPGEIVARRVVIEQARRAEVVRIDRWRGKSHARGVVARDRPRAIRSAARSR